MTQQIDYSSGRLTITPQEWMRPFRFGLALTALCWLFEYLADALLIFTRPSEPQATLVIFRVIVLALLPASIWYLTETPKPHFGFLIPRIAAARLVALPAGAINVIYLYQIFTIHDDSRYNALFPVALGDALVHVGIVLLPFGIAVRSLKCIGWKGMAIELQLIRIALAMMCLLLLAWPLTMWLAFHVMPVAIYAAYVLPFVVGLFYTVVAIWCFIYFLRLWWCLTMVLTKKAS